MEVMLDLETLSTRSNASILVIAAIKFDRHSNISKPTTTSPNQFYAKIDTNSCSQLGMHIDPKTIHWWWEQDSKIREEAFGNPREDLKSVLLRFSKWYGNSKAIWSHGATFDIPILAEAYNLCGLEPPWKFWLARDTRTLFDITGIRQEDLPNENLHNALYDCWRQICGVQEALKRLKK